MTSENANIGPSSLAEYAAILWRRRFTVLAVVVSVPLVAVALSSLQGPEYEATSEVLVRSGNLAAVLSGVPDTSSGQDPTRLLDTQARLARTPVVATAAAKGAGNLSAEEMLQRTSVSADPGADILTFTAKASTPPRAVALANAYADAFARYRNDLDLRPVEDALSEVNARLARLRRAKLTSSALYSTLVARQQQLESISAVHSQSAVVVSRASGAEKTKPRPLHAALLGLIAGVLLGVAFALVREAMEKRTRSGDEVQQRLGLRILARIPATADGGTLVTRSHPDSIDAEAYRLLRMHFEQAITGGGGKVFAVISAGEGEGKSTVASNLAIALARVGRDVLLVDCDPLRPVLRDRFGVKRAGAGVFEVATGQVELEAALSDVPYLPSPVAQAESRLIGESNPGVEPEPHVEGPLVWHRPEEHDVRPSLRVAVLGDESGGRLRVLPANNESVDMSDQLVATKLPRLLDQLRDEADLVILDAAPLSTSTGMGVAQIVDGLVVVTNVSLMRRPVLEHLRRLLDDIGVEKVGVVLTGLDPDAIMSYGYQYYARTSAVRLDDHASSAASSPVEKRWSSAS